MTPAKWLSQTPRQRYRHEYRFGVRLLVPASDSLMLLHENIAKCVAYAASKKGAEFAICGTVFFVAYPIEGTDHYETYAVTAAHVVEGCFKSDGRVYFRINETNGTASYLQMDASEWEFHEDPCVDVAAATLHWSSDDAARFDYISVVPECFLNDELMARLNIAPGAELYFPGLFVRHPGNQSNIPIIRAGNIAAIPKEKMDTSRGKARLHLAELRSIGGHSGSPVFVNMNNFQRKWALQDLKESGELHEFLFTLPLFGMMHGYLHLSPGQFVANDTSPSAILVENINSGIAGIVPASDILHVFNQPRFTKQRMVERDRIISSYGSTVPTAPEPN